MTNAERQKKLDDAKYFASLQVGTDLSGSMDYCKKCDYRDKKEMRCLLDHEDRIADNTCAKAYNKAKKTK